MAALVRATRCFRKFPLNVFGCAAAATGRLQAPAVKAVAAAGAATDRFQMPRVKAVLSGWAAPTSVRMYHPGGNYRQSLVILRLLENIKAKMEESQDRDEVLLNLLQAMFVQRSLQVSEHQGYVIIAMLHKILAREAEKAEKTSEKAVMVVVNRGEPTWNATIYKGFELTKVCAVLRVWC